MNLASRALCNRFLDIFHATTPQWMDPDGTIARHASYAPNMREEHHIHCLPPTLRRLILDTLSPICSVRKKKMKKKKHKIPGVPGVPHVAESGWGNDPIPSHSSGIDTPTNGIPDQMTLMDPRRVPEGFGSTTRSYPRR